MKKNDFSIVFIGTSSGKTSLKRFHSSLLVKSKSFSLLIDCGDGASKALLSQSISLDMIDGILFSHLHPDHSAGFASLIVQMKQLKRKKKLKIFCHKNLTQVIKMFLKHSFVFTERTTFQLEYFEFEHDEEMVVTNGVKFLSKQNSHLDKYLNHLEDKAGFASSSFLFELGKKKVVYSGDVSKERDLYLFEKESPEIIITEIAHVTWDEIFKFYASFKPKKIFLIHYSDEVKKVMNAKIRALPKRAQKKIILSEDGMCLKL